MPRVVLVCCIVVALLAGCGGGNAGEATHVVPGFDVSLTLPASWDAVDHERSGEEIDRFERDHPAFTGVAERLRAGLNGLKLAAADDSGEAQVLVSINDAPTGYTLRQHIQKSLLEFDSTEAALRQVRVHGPRQQVVELAGGHAWKLRWSISDAGRRIQVLQYTFVLNGRTYLVTFRTGKPSKPFDAAFAAAALSLRIGPAGDSGSSLTAGTGRIAFSRECDNENLDVFVIDLATSQERRLTRTGRDSQPSWSPDGALLAFATKVGEGSEIRIIRANGSGRRRLTTGAQDFAPSWSLDRRRLMFTRGDCEQTCDLYAVNVDGSGLTQVTEDGDSAFGSWSPDGRRIVFWSSRDGSGVYVMNADANEVKKLTLDFDAAWGPRWSPDGSSILFVGTKASGSGGDDRPSIYRMDSDGDHIREIAPATGYWIDEPTWSPDGASIAYFSDARGPGAIWVMKADGTRQRPLTTTGDSHSPSWTSAPG